MQQKKSVLRFNFRGLKGQEVLKFIEDYQHNMVTLFPVDVHGLPDGSESVTTVLSLLKFRSIVMLTTS
jgi:hypothetical protein